MKIKMNAKYSTLLLLALLLQSCATMSRDECLQADWYIKGLADASDGYALDRIDDHGKACARVGVVPKVQDYEAGHKKGARLFCVANKGYSEGRRGASYNGICPQDLEQNFLRAYRDGQDLFALQQQITQLNSDISHYQAIIETDYDEIHRLKHEIADRDSDPQERRYKLRRIDELHYQITDLQIQLDRSLYQIQWINNDYRALENKHYQMGYTQY